MKNKKVEFPIRVVNSTHKSIEKSIWISPEIVNWENDNIENAVGAGADGGAKTYL